MLLPGAPPSLSPRHLHITALQAGVESGNVGAWGRSRMGYCAALRCAEPCYAVLGSGTVGISGGSPCCACLTSAATLACVSAGARLQRAQRRQQLAATARTRGVLVTAPLELYSDVMYVARTSEYSKPCPHSSLRFVVPSLRLNPSPRCPPISHAYRHLMLYTVLACVIRKAVR